MFRAAKTVRAWAVSFGAIVSAMVQSALIVRGVGISVHEMFSSRATRSARSAWCVVKNVTMISSGIMCRWVGGHLAQTVAKMTDAVHCGEQAGTDTHGAARAQ
jgi:hypothetical protein